MKWIDLPPVWLAACVAVVWIGPQMPPYVPAQSLIGAVFIGAGLLMMCLAVFEMRAHRTTVIPHLNASALVSSGVFAVTRNPIYLGDVFVLIGLILRWQAHPALFLLVPVFIFVIRVRFIEPEEDRLRTVFGDAFDAYCNAVRRWF